MKRRQGGFTFIEILVCVVVGCLALGVMLTLYYHTIRAQHHARINNDALEGCLLLLARLERDLKQIRVVPGRPVSGYAFRLSNDGRSITLRKPSARGRVGDPDEIVMFQCAKRSPDDDLFIVTRKHMLANGTVVSEHSFSQVGVRTLRFAVAPQARDLLVLRVRLLVEPVGANPRNVSWPAERVFRIPCAYGATGRGDYAVLPAPREVP